jgi:superfamily II DNA or RNA helicase
MEQWQERIGEFLELRAGEKLGIIQGTINDWQRPITLAMIHTLALRADEGQLPPGFTKHFGVVFFDEVHHLAAPLFVKTAPLVHGLRYGLTATPKRTDGMEFVYNYHIGPVFFEDMEADLVPRVYFQETPTYLDLSDSAVKDKSGELNMSRLRSVLGENKEGNLFRAYCIQEALDQGRKILALSHSKNQLRLMHEIFPQSGLIIQETPQKERTGIVKSSQLVFAISRLGVEGLDDAALDSLFYLTPFSAENDLQQGLGRIQRAHGDKSQPVAVIFEDVLIPPLRSMCNKLRKALVAWKVPYQTLKVPHP